MQMIQIVISPNGDTRVSTHGYRALNAKKLAESWNKLSG